MARSGAGAAALQTKMSAIPSCLAILLAVRTAVKKESSLTVFERWRATVMVRPAACLRSTYSSPYSTSRYFIPAGISLGDLI